MGQIIDFSKYYQRAQKMRQETQEDQQEFADSLSSEEDLVTKLQGVVQRWRESEPPPDIPQEVLYEVLLQNYENRLQLLEEKMQVRLSHSLSYAHSEPETSYSLLGSLLKGESSRKSRVEVLKKKLAQAVANSEKR